MMIGSAFPTCEHRIKLVLGHGCGGFPVFFLKIRRFYGYCFFEPFFWLTRCV